MTASEIAIESFLDYMEVTCVEEDFSVYDARNPRTMTMCYDKNDKKYYFTGLVDGEEQDIEFKYSISAKDVAEIALSINREWTDDDEERLRKFEKKLGI